MTMVQSRRPLPPTSRSAGFVWGDWPRRPAYRGPSTLPPCWTGRVVAREINPAQKYPWVKTHR
jgi:hypothetical protein